MSRYHRSRTERTIGDSGEKPTIAVTITVDVSDDAPPELVRAVTEGLLRLVAAGTDEETGMKIAAELREIKARKQRQADRVARLLVGDSEAPE